MAFWVYVLRRNSIKALRYKCIFVIANNDYNWLMIFFNKQIKSNNYCLLPTHLNNFNSFTISGTCISYNVCSIWY